MLRHLTRREGLVTLVSACLATLASAQFQSDPFQPGLRSTYTASAASAWLPQAVDFAANGELLWVAGSGNSNRVGLLSSAPAGAIQPELVDSAFNGASGALSVASAARADRLFAAAQYPTTDASHVRTVVSAHDALFAAGQGVFAPRWTHDAGIVGNGPARLACDATAAKVVVALSDALTGTARIDWLDGATGALAARVDLAASPLRALAVAKDLSRTAIVIGTKLWVFDANGVTVHQENLGAATYALALSGDASRLIVGAQNKLRVLARNPNSSYADLHVVTAAPGELATRVALSDDGSTWAAGWWNAVSPSSIRFELWDGPSQTRKWYALQSGPPGGLQNYPEAVAVTPDGRRAAFAAWGVLDSQPEVLLVDKALAAPVLSLDLPGSALSLALDDGGTRVAVGMKHVHANQFGATGEFRVYDTGERDLQTTAAPRHGGTLELSARRAGATHVLFAIGQLASHAQPFPGSVGTLWIDRKAAPLVFARAADAQGEAHLSVPLTNSSSAIGVHFAVQAAARVASKLYFSATVVEPIVL
jgi:hypothetical protein